MVVMMSILLFFFLCLVLILPCNSYYVTTLSRSTNRIKKLNLYKLRTQQNSPESSLHISTSSVSNDLVVTSRKRLPVTVLSGFLGAGKTTLLQHILTSDHKGKRYAVIVNDMNEVNIDGSLVQPFISYKQEELVEMSNGCICCTLRDDLLKEVSKIAQENKFDHLIIESTGIAEPLPIAETFTFQLPGHNDNREEDEDEVSDYIDVKRGEESSSEILMDFAEIDSMVTLVDAVNFLHDIKAAEDLAARNLQADENDARTITDLLVSQVEFATVIIINKCDLVSSEQLLEVKRMVRALNSDAKIVDAVRSKIDINEVIGSRGFDFEKVSQSPTWIKAINDHSEKIPETEEYGISSFVYRARKPFHPTRLMDFINTAFQSSSSDSDDDDDDEVNEVGVDTAEIDIGTSKILRSKGFFWLATEPGKMMVWSQAGGLFEFSPSGPWWKNTSKDQWPTDDESIQQIMADFDPDEFIGDRRQELVFIGATMEKEKVSSRLDECLLQEDEMNAGEDQWMQFNNPFPSYE